MPEHTPSHKMTKVSKDTFNDLSEKKYLLFRKCVCVVVQFLVIMIMKAAIHYDVSSYQITNLKEDKHLQLKVILKFSWNLQ
jgi:hypothetical protein